MEKTSCLLNLDISVEWFGNMTREQVAQTLGAWIENLPRECRNITTTNDDMEIVKINVKCCTAAR